MTAAIRTWSGRLVARPWLAAFVPINAATSGFAVVLPLLILISLHGSWAEVAVAATLFNAAVILSSIAWGHLSDAYPHRRLFLVVNYGVFAALYAVLSGVGSVYALYAIYTVLGVVSPAGVSASNLLILEKFGEEERATAFASFQEMSMVGSLVGLLVGYFWTVSDDALRSLLYVLAGLAAASAVLFWFWITEAPRQLTTGHVARHPESLFSRLRPHIAWQMPVPFFPARPSWRPRPVARFRAWAKEELRHELPLILLASFLFNLSANLFNISYTPYLYAAGLAASSIFLVNLANNFVQTLVFPVTGPLANRIGVDRLVGRATYFRSIGYLATAAFAFASLAHATALGANVLVYALLGGAVAVYTTASSLMLFRGLGHRDPGRLLGVNSALGGVAAVGGAGLSGVLALLGSFQVVFLVASALLLVSLPLWAAATLAYSRRRGAAGAAAVAPPPELGPADPAKPP
ncbi:MAG TPA: MFS transporter [Thermoplasmata archaeon]|nr:MFS transporter [Thermoplasmata archaeon]